MSVNYMMNTFSEIVREIADPLFVKHTVKYPSFERNIVSDSAEWFDEECRNA